MCNSRYVFFWLIAPFLTMVGMVAMPKKGAKKEAGIQQYTLLVWCCLKYCVGKYAMDLAMVNGRF